MSTQPPPTPQRIAIPSDLIVPATSVSIPLHLFPVPGKPGEYKVGIVVAAKDSAGNTQDARMYEFDTGGQGFWMEASPGLPVPSPADCTLSILYASGIEYSAAPQLLTLAFPESSATADASHLSTQAVVGVVREIVPYAKAPDEVPEQKKFPIFGQFYGDFGAALQGFSQTPGAPPSLLTVLAQLPAPYNNGFIVDVGPYPGGDSSTSAPGQLIVGLTPQLRALFTSQVAMIPATPYLPSTGGSPIDTFQEAAITATLAVGTAGNAGGIGVVFDTGAPTTEIHEGKVVTPGPFAPVKGETLSLVPTTPASFSILDYVIGTTPGVDLAQSTGVNVLLIEDGYINTGLNPFFQSQVMFDLANGAIGFPNTLFNQPAP